MTRRATIWLILAVLVAVNMTAVVALHDETMRPATASVVLNDPDMHLPWTTPPRPVPTPTRTPARARDTVWDRLAGCESDGRWHINTGNGFYGGTQTEITTWRSFHGTQFAVRPDLASRHDQIVVDRRILRGQGWGAWPVCSRKIGRA